MKSILLGLSMMVVATTAQSSIFEQYEGNYRGECLLDDGEIFLNFARAYLACIDDDCTTVAWNGIFMSGRFGADGEVTDSTRVNSHSYSHTAGNLDLSVIQHQDGTIIPTLDAQDVTLRIMDGGRHSVFKISEKGQFLENGNLLILETHYTGSRFGVIRCELLKD